MIYTKIKAIRQIGATCQVEIQGHVKGNEAVDLASKLKPYFTQQPHGFLLVGTKAVGLFGVSMRPFTYLIKSKKPKVKVELLFNGRKRGVHKWTTAK